MELLVRRYAEEHDRAGARVWVDHTPHNTNYAVRLLDMFPEARFIHTV